jgi:hypothetical protein
VADAPQPMDPDPIRPEKLYQRPALLVPLAVRLTLSKQAQVGAPVVDVSLAFNSPTPRSIRLRERS